MFSVPCKQNMSNDAYHAHPAIGSTSLKNIERSPAHYLWERDNQSDTPSKARGRIIHEALLEPERFNANAIIMPEFSGKGSRAAKDQWLMENHGKTIVKADDMVMVRGIMRSVANHKSARSLLAGGMAESSYFWQDADTGLVCKCRPDFLRKGHIIVDIKSTTDASPKAFSRTIAKYRYHLSAAHYCTGVSAVEGQNYNEFVIIAVETEPPYGVAVYLLDEGTMGAGAHIRKQALLRLKQCKETNFYPGYPDHIQSIAIPHWEFPAEEAV